MRLFLFEGTDFAGGGEEAGFEFAKTIVGMAAAGLGRSLQVVPIRTRDHPTLTLRAPDTGRDCSRIFQTFGIEPRPRRQALKGTVDRLLTQRGAA